MAMGIVKFSFVYVISARDKQFYGVPLSNVIQEQFPMHGVMFVLYTLLTLIGLYFSGMGYNIIPLICLCGALLAFLSTCIMALLFTFSHELKRVIITRVRARYGEIYSEAQSTQFLKTHSKLENT